MKVLVIGGGSIGKRHISNLKFLGYDEIVCLKRSHDQSFETEHRVTVVTSYAAAAKLGVGAIIVCTPTSLHNRALQFGVEHNLPIFMEKPLIHSAEGLVEAQSLLKDAKKVFFLGFMLRYHDLLKEIKKWLDSNKLGKVYNARLEFGSYLPYWHPSEDYKVSYASRKDLGGGVINTITHELDLIQYLFGIPSSVTCCAQSLGKLDIAVEEQCDAIFEYPDKMVSLHLDYLQKDYDRRIRILCDDGVIQWNWHDEFVLIKEHKQETHKIASEKKFDVNQLYVDELSDFFKLINNHQTNHQLDEQYAISNTELMLAMHQSSMSGKKIQII